MTPPEASAPPPSRRRQWLFTLLAAVLALAALEGLGTALLLTADLVRWSQPVLAERHHSAYDPEIGWVPLPDQHLPNLFGPGIGLRTNHRGFRRDQETEPQVAAGKTRILCSGDSFTFGYGVANHETWPALLERAHPNLEVVNLGMSGYGFDQAYLWYRRAGLPLEHQVQVFAFIADDFERMRRAKAFGYDKPRLTVEGGELKVENVPVPALAIRYPWWIKNGHHFRRVSLVRLVSRAVRAVRGPTEALPDLTYGTMVATVETVIEDLQQHHRSQGSHLVLMSLPVRRELQPEVEPPDMAFLRDLAERHEIPYVDVVAAARSLPAEQRRTLFGRPGFEDDQAMAEHFSVAGNIFTAEVLAEHLGHLPGFGVDR